jgi:hypothetical protein
MSKQEMIEIVDNQVKYGLPREEAIRLLAFFMDEDDPENHAEMWFQQKIGGG